MAKNTENDVALEVVSYCRPEPFNVDSCPDRTLWRRSGGSIPGGHHRVWMTKSVQTGETTEPHDRGDTCPEVAMAVQ
jgi:hypothetical protein